MNKILDVRNLKVTFPIQGKEIAAVDGVSFSLDQGKVLGLVGESGCGKTLTALSLLKLVEEPGRIVDGQAFYFGNVPGISPSVPAHPPKVAEDEFEELNEETAPGVEDAPKKVENTDSLNRPDLVPVGGIDLLQLNSEEMRQVRGNKIAMIFQEPMSSLNPVFTIGFQIIEAIMLHQKVGKAEAREIAIDMLRKVRIADPEKRIDDYPHQLSGGMRQRVMIAMALSCKPDILIADEPTTALDVTIQAQILELIQELINDMHMSVILITHDLGVVAQICDDVVVMYSGMVVESAGTKRLFRRPKHPYTMGLLHSIPKLFEDKQEKLYSIAGTVPDLLHRPEGCRFVDRCFRACKACSVAIPQFKYVGEKQEVRCLNY